MVQPHRHACLLAVSEEQRAEVAARFIRGGEDVVCFGREPDWLLRRLHEDGFPPVEVFIGAPSCEAVATLQSGDRLLCLFDNATLTGTRRTEVLAGHDEVLTAPALYDDGVLRITRLADGLRLAGELDISNRHAVIDVMRTGPAAIDMGSLRFVDAGGVVALYAAAHHRVRLLRTQPVPRRVVELFDPQAERLICEGADHG